MRTVLSTELSDREIYLIGSIVSHWGFLESEIFEQTLLSFGDDEPLPREMNNVQFSGILQLWLNRVVNRKDGDRKTVLMKQYDDIIAMNEYRQAIVHSRWEWNTENQDEITAVRVHKKTVTRVKFTADDLAEFSTKLGQTRYLVRYPGGNEDRAAEIDYSGGYVSRKGWDLLFGRASLDDPENANDDNQPL